MKVIFSPEYSGNVFVRPEGQGCVLMDTVVVNTIGLVSLLELRAGFHYKDIPANERLAFYYDALGKYLKDNPTNVLSASFKLSGLSTAEAVLAWRDDLRYAGWNFKGLGISGRIDAIIGAEKYFAEALNEYCGNTKYCDIVDRLAILIDAMGQKNISCSDITLSIPCAEELLHPMEQNLVKAMIECGAVVEMQTVAAESNDNLGKARHIIIGNENEKIRWQPKDKDKSLMIWRFDNETAANEYLSYYDMKDVDVWINADNKQMDNWLYLMGKPLTGSNMDDCCPQLFQMFVIGLSMFGNPLNVSILLEWLNMPVHPIDGYFRKVLADTIADEGGYRNKACEDLIKKYVDGGFVRFYGDDDKLTDDEKKNKIKGDRKRREKYVEIFLPSLKQQETFVTETLRNFVAELSSWCRQRAHLMSENNSNELWREQLLYVTSMADAFALLLRSVDTDSVDERIISSWISTIYRKASFVNTVAEQGCRIVTDSPSNLVSVAGKTVWMGVEGDEGRHLECSFLSLTEREALVKKGYVHLWDEDSERRYHEQMVYQSFMKTSDQLVIVVCERRDGELTQKHPLIVRLEQMAGKPEDIDLITLRPRIDESLTLEAEKIVKEPNPAELEIEHADKIKWPDHLSPTRADTLIKYPFDYLMEQLLHIEPDSKAQMVDVKTTMGNVAHAVIERIFAPRNGEDDVAADKIEQRLSKEFETAYSEVVEAKGAILLLPENKLVERLLHEQMQKCLEVLLDIIRENNLKVIACERMVSDNFELGLPEKTDNEGNPCGYDMVGFIDMELKDALGVPVIFDFKWTSSKKYYQNLLSENRSIQLEMYRKMLSDETGRGIDRVAYFLMPEARLYSSVSFNSDHCTKIDPVNNDNIVTEVRNSILYRKEQLINGKVEMNGEFETLKYVSDTVDENLFPLDKAEDTGMKKTNIFSNYELF